MFLWIDWLIDWLINISLQGEIKHLESRNTPDNNEDRMKNLMEMLIDASQKAIGLSCRILGVGKFLYPNVNRHIVFF